MQKYDRTIFLFILWRAMTAQQDFPSYMQSLHLVCDPIHIPHGLVIDGDMIVNPTDHPIDINSTNTSTTIHCRLVEMK